MVDKYSGKAGKHVEGVRKDPVKLLTINLLRNITDSGKSHAEINYRGLLDLIQSKGYLGKDIRYARTQLNEHARYLRSNGANAKAKQAELYAQRLPKPAEDRRERHSIPSDISIYTNQD